MSSSGHDSTAQSQASTNTRGKTDVAWNHCSEGRATDGKRILTCLYCQKAIKGGGINRVKQHLAGKKGEVGLCRRVPPDIKHEMEQSLKNIEQNKKEKVDMRSFDDPYEGVDVDVEQETSPSDNVPTKGKEKKLGNFFTSKPQPEKQPTIKSAMAGKEAVWRANMAVARWFYDCCIPFNAVNSIYFQPMFDAAIRVGLGYRVPSYHDVRVNLLRDSKKEVTLFVETMRSFWGDCGCTIMWDGWTDGRHRSLINFLVYCPRGIYFVKSVDASDAVKSGNLLAKLFIDVIEWVGPTNVFHMVTDNGANYVLAGKLVSEQYKNISWSPCAAHCLNLILGDIAKMNHIVELAKKASKITKFIYNLVHGWLLAWLRKRKDWIEIIRPGPTRFATTFIALHNVYDHMHDLQAFVTSKDFKESRYAKEAQGKVVVSYILDKKFWNDCLIVTKIVESLMRVLRIIDMDERPSIAYLYDGMFRARKAIKKVFRQKKSLYKPYTNIIKERWDKQLRKSVHAAAYWLNPCFQYNQESFCGKPEVMAGLLDVIEAKATTSKVKLLEETRIYRERMRSFGRELALTTSKTTQPDEWWRLFGSSAPNLQKLAIKVLSQTSSSSGCERNWSVFDRIHTKKRNRLEHQRLNDHYNLRHFYKRWNYDPIDYESIGKTEFWIIEDEE